MASEIVAALLLHEGDVALAAADLLASGSRCTNNTNTKRKNFSIDALIKKGSNASVYRGTWGDDPNVVIKKFDKKKVGRAYVANEFSLGKKAGEAGFAAKMYSFGGNNTHYLIFQEYLEKPATLTDYSEFLDLVKNMFEETGIEHGDPLPNLRRDSEDTLKFIDFGKASKQTPDQLKFVIQRAIKSVIENNPRFQGGTYTFWGNQTFTRKANFEYGIMESFDEETDVDWPILNQIQTWLAEHNLDVPRFEVSGIP
jgi:predicted Ser/Thr protein kinase